MQGRAGRLPAQNSACFDAICTGSVSAPAAGTNPNAPHAFAAQAPCAAVPALHTPSTEQGRAQHWSPWHTEELGPSCPQGQPAWQGQLTLSQFLLIFQSRQNLLSTPQTNYYYAASFCLLILILAVYGSVLLQGFTENRKNNTFLTFRY